MNVNWKKINQMHHLIFYKVILKKLISCLTRASRLFSKAKLASKVHWMQIWTLTQRSHESVLCMGASHNNRAINFRSSVAAIWNFHRIRSFGGQKLLCAPLRLSISLASFIYIEQQRRSISNSSGRHYVAHTARTLLQKAPPIGLDLVLYTSVYNSGALAYIYYKEILLTVSLPAARCGHQRSSRQRRRRQENKPPAAPWAKSCVCAPVSECTLGSTAFFVFICTHSGGMSSKINIRAGWAFGKCTCGCTSEIAQWMDSCNLRSRQMS